MSTSAREITIFTREKKPNFIMFAVLSRYLRIK